MDAEFWRVRWREGRIGFHQDEVHPLLERFGHRFPPGGRILVPLAGKSLDMRHLAREGHEVIGVEWVEEAARAFFREAGTSPTEETVAGHVHLRTPKIELVVGDFLDTTPRQIGQVDGVYDRASFIALPPELRARYAAHLASLLSRDTGVLMVTVSYQPGVISGPPFSVRPTEIEAVFGGPFEVFHLETIDALDDNPHLRDRGLTRLVEHAMWLRRRG